jgi:hypothetical protein
MYQALNREDKYGRKKGSGAGPRNSNNRYFLGADPAQAGKACYVCAGPHDSQSCPSKRCFSCAATGHESMDCPEAVRCEFCGVKGHGKRNKSACPLEVYKEGKALCLRGGARNLMCMKCGEMGTHLNCAPFIGKNRQTQSGSAGWEERPRSGGWSDEPKASSWDNGWRDHDNSRVEEEGWRPRVRVVGGEDHYLPTGPSAVVVRGK